MQSYLIYICSDLKLCIFSLGAALLRYRKIRKHVHSSHFFKFLLTALSHRPTSYQNTSYYAFIIKIHAFTVHQVGVDSDYAAIHYSQSFTNTPGPLLFNFHLCCDNY